MRLDKFLSHNTPLSRSQVRRAVRAGRITVNGAPSQSAAQALGEFDQVSLDGKPIAARGHEYYMLHKPAGVLCATSDGHQPTVLDLLLDATRAIGPPPRAERLHLLQVAGRLDKDTTGLVLLTTDGQWNHRVTTPGDHCGKIYEVELAEAVDTASLPILQSGMRLRGDDKPTHPADVRLITARELELTLYEGRYHQIKRMFAATGNRVTRLHRRSVGAISLDEGLPPGHFRALTRPEIDSVQLEFSASTAGER